MGRLIGNTDANSGWIGADDIYAVAVDWQLSRGKHPVQLMSTGVYRLRARSFESIAFPWVRGKFNPKNYPAE